MRALVRALPDLVRLVVGLARDPAVPTTAKVALAAAVAYLASPVDLVPDFIPVLGYLDDVLLAAVLLDGLLNFVDRRLVLRYWPGSAEALDRLARTARVLAAWVPRRLKARIFS